jgi:antitoxin VapB
MQLERQVRLFRNGRKQALRISRELELELDVDVEEAIVRKDGERLIVEPIKRRADIANLLSGEGSPVLAPVGYRNWRSPAGPGHPLPGSKVGLKARSR